MALTAEQKTRFYSTTLGLNPWSALQNLLQSTLTARPALARMIRESPLRLADYSPHIPLLDDTDGSHS